MIATELKDLDSELKRFHARLLAAAVFVLLLFGLLAARLWYLQVFRHDELATQAEANRIALLPAVPNRGLIVDRNEVVLATNYSAYTLEITPNRVPGGAAGLEALIEELATMVEIGPRERRRFKRILEENKSFDSVPIRARLTDEEVARFTAQRFRFPAVDIKARLFRQYPHGELGSHLLGYIGRINPAEQRTIETWPDEVQANYNGTEYIGKLGLEQAYESVLHGQTGVEEVETTASGRALRRLRSQPATPGSKLVLSIDIKLQALIEELFGDRRGALVALDPRNGEVLAFVSKPTFDPNLFVEGIDVESWRELNESIDKPLLNRALRGTYPPGSTYKPFMAMAALSSGSRAPETIIQDNLVFWFGGNRFGSPENERGGAMDMRRAIVESSNVYFYTLANEMGVNLMHEHLSPLGFGRKTGIDLEGEVTGDLPSTEWKKRKFRKPEQQKWYAGETISLGIGQGYNNFTMLQMATAMSTVVSGGLRFKPRLVREVEDPVSGQRKPLAAAKEAALEAMPYSAEHVAFIRNALAGVAKEGTSARVFAGAGYVSGGKTGTAQAVALTKGERYRADRVEEHKRDHSLYVAAAPINAPTVALAVIVENAGWGAAAAAPIARRVFDYLLMGQYPSEQDLALVREGKAGAPVGMPRKASEVPLPTLYSNPAQSAAGAPVAPAASAGSAAPAAVPGPQSDEPREAQEPESPALAASASAAASVAASRPTRRAPKRASGAAP